MYNTDLIEKYPALFNESLIGLECGDGWYPILNNLCFCINSYLEWMNRKEPVVEPVSIIQIKEKFGTLRFYYEGGDERIFGMVRMAEAMSSVTCEECGKPGISRKGGWIKTLCDEHAK